MTTNKIYDLIDELEDAVTAMVQEGYGAGQCKRVTEARAALYLAALRATRQDPWAAHLEVWVDGVPQELDWRQQAELEGEDRGRVEPVAPSLHPVFEQIFAERGWMTKETST